MWLQWGILDLQNGDVNLLVYYCSSPIFSENYLKMKKLDCEQVNVPIYAHPPPSSLSPNFPTTKKWNILEVFTKAGSEGEAL